MERWEGGSLPPRLVCFVSPERGSTRPRGRGHCEAPGVAPTFGEELRPPALPESSTGDAGQDQVEKEGTSGAPRG